MTNPDWALSAVCQSVDPELFFPEKRGSTTEAKKVCAGCPVRAECLAYALAHDGVYRHGIYGGLSAYERSQLAPARVSNYKQRTIRHGTEGGYYTHRRRGEQPCSHCTEAATAAHQRRKHRRQGRRVVAQVSGIRDTVVAS